ncbi:MAG: HlyC/CorC family transporter, partial [Lachnospiraceae bacterium]|nr:HlyC/CorC family transporter [Lachnospiraceae bacterium]
FGEQEFETINGYLVSLMEKIPEEDDLFETRIENYRFKVLEVENKVIKTIQVTPILQETEESLEDASEE